MSRTITRGEAAGANAPLARPAPRGDPVPAPAGGCGAAAATAFRNFGRPGAAPERERYSGLADPVATQAMLATLMRRMARPHVYADGVSSADVAANQTAIPAGYTYLAQFVGHDLVRNSAPLAGLDAPETDHRNMQAPGLRLHTLYGDGPSVNEASYEAPRKGEDVRTRLRTGPVAVAAGEPWTHPFRDIPRAAQADLSDPGSPAGRPDVLIADRRNDANAVLAQITALFHHIHNAVVDAVRASPRWQAAAPPVLQDARTFQTARRATTVLYRRVVLHDLLPRLVRASVWSRYEANGFAPLVDRSADGMPLEFSHAACRLGHSMVRMAYRFNADSAPEGIRDVLRNVSAARPGRFPPEARWIAAWSNFFEMGDGHPPPQFGRRIGPAPNPVLLAEDAFPNEAIGGAGAARPHPDCAGLLFRDLVRGTIGGLLKLDVILEALPGEVRATAPLLADAAGRRAALRAWLAATDIAFSPDELDHLSADPPLNFWMLFEAATEAGGLGFGTLGSVVFADVVLAHLAPLPEDAEAEALLADLFPGQALRTMPELVALVADRLGLRDATPRFI